jgi:hypothetical protein
MSLFHVVLFMEVDVYLAHQLPASGGAPNQLTISTFFWDHSPYPYEIDV